MNARPMIRACALCLLVTFSVVPIGGIRAETLTVFAASSLTDVVKRLAEDFSRATGVEVRTAHASSSQLARKIEFGAPAHVFLSADREWTDYLVEKGLIDQKLVRPFATNRLVMVRPHPPFPDSLTELAALATLRDGQRIALGNPDHVPVGRYAKEALVGLRLWQFVEGRLASMPNARAVLALVERGEVAAGFVYRTDSLVSRSVSVVAEIPPSRHRPILYMAAITEIGARSPDSHAFVDYLLSPQGQQIIIRHGFSGISDGG